MVTPEFAVEVRHAACDTSSDAIYVEGEVGAGKAVYLKPRRYRRQPDWWVVEVVTVDAPTEQPQGFRLSCATEGMWGTEGIEVLEPESATTRRIDRPPPANVDADADASADVDADTDEPSQPLRKLGGGTRIVRSGGPDPGDSGDNSE